MTPWLINNLTPADIIPGRLRARTRPGSHAGLPGLKTSWPAPSVAALFRAATSHREHITGGG
eukprot:7397925-Alexandrium_andersonii.AAC.1